VNTSSVIAKGLRTNAAWRVLLSMLWSHLKKLSVMQGGRPKKKMTLRQQYDLPRAHLLSLTRYQGVYLGSGIGSLDDVYDTTVAFEKGVSKSFFRMQC
jgi:hypothetical protein